ncbi:MAG TPA: PhoX family phosphatase [Candidatus Paenalcaligenes intestinipullorum]|uniref:PhoX family phosphatase n=1 Tax=Candidatus Paenalcaligenes intestinipullorum TaxID=2838718 RepID=A0A9D2RJQ3_9BURK|nr:PhoX family phosphatase [Candidatus Paenalcaligenes intestinipullorum]
MSQPDWDDIPSNPSNTTPFNEVVAQLKGRRQFIKTGLGASALSFLGLGAGLLPTQIRAQTSTAPSSQTLGFGFEPLGPSTADAITLPKGYAHQVINRWGDPLFDYSPAFKGDATDGGAEQALQVGFNHDGMHFFPIDAQLGGGQSSTEGLLVTNHEYITPHFFFPEGVVPGNANWNGDWVLKSQHAQGASVVHMRLVDGRWQAVLDSPFNRSINATTPMRVVGPAAGHALMQTSADPSGQWAVGTFGNCGNGWTPWNTYLTCEENFTDYFGVGTQNPAQADYPDAATQAHMERYKGANKEASEDYRWDTHDSRFNWTQEPNEANRFGWIVEIDPFDPHSAPKKLAALGRFKHENAAWTLAPDQRVVVYMGDDQRSEYIYKFVSKNAFNPETPALNRLLLDEGVLYVAKFHGSTAQEEDLAGQGEWVALTLDTPTLDGKKLGDLFQDMGELLIKTRQAADAVGATPMDRPEWVAVHPQTKEVYTTLTNNSHRGSDKERWPNGLKHPTADGPNPRNENKYGQIVRWREQGADPTALRFEWDVFVLAGNPNVYEEGDSRRGSATITAQNTFNSPDGLAFDQQGRLWIQTDGNYSDRDEYLGQGNNSMLIANPASKEIHRFLVGPKGCEVTGITWTPDQRYVFINIQHPGEGQSIEDAQKQPNAVSTWPDGAQSTRPRPATVVIWREDGGQVGA